MPLCAFMGDEVSAAGFRLAGVEVHVPEPKQVPDLFRRLLQESELVILTAAVASSLPQAGLRHAQSAARPLVLVVPDVRGRFQPPDLVAELGRQLGITE
jgi:vacuolar-type H+-ATPase subunit F/Vma7